jgi:N-acetylneuraminate synthase
MSKVAGCEYVKFQKRTVEKVYTKEELDKPRESPFGTTNREQKMALEFSALKYIEIDDFCKHNNIGWFASPWDIDSVDFIASMRVPYIKIASASLTDFRILEHAKVSGIPIILSTGMSTYEEVKKVTDYLGNQIEYILACCSAYPCKAEESKLNMIKVLKDYYPQYKIGYSNHSPGLTFCIAAAALGAEMIEFHITLDRAMYGSDQASSIEPQGVMSLVKHIRDIEKSMSNSINNQWTIFDSEIKIKEKLRKK